MCQNVGVWVFPSIFKNRDCQDQNTKKSIFFSKITPNFSLEVSEI